jgi:hypothetical protein
MSKKSSNAKRANSVTKGKSENAPINAKAPAPQIEDKDMQLVLLLDKYTVEGHFLDDVEGQLIDIYPSLLEEADYSPAEIVGETFWANLTNLGQRIAILCLKHLATEPDVPLVDVTCECCGKTSFQVV